MNDYICLRRTLSIYWIERMLSQPSPRSSDRLSSGDSQKPNHDHHHRQAPHCFDSSERCITQNHDLTTILTQPLLLVYALHSEHDVNIVARIVGFILSVIPAFYTSFRGNITWVGWILCGVAIGGLIVEWFSGYPDGYRYQCMTNSLWTHFETQLIIGLATPNEDVLAQINLGCSLMCDGSKLLELHWAKNGCLRLLRDLADKTGGI